MLSFVCSVGNVPLAAVLWAGGISFAGVIAFIYADLIVDPDPAHLPQVLRDEGRCARRVDHVRCDRARRARSCRRIFDVAGLIPETRPDVESITERGIEWNYTTFLNILFFGVAAVLVGLTLRRGARDPVCGMTVDRQKTPFRSEWAGKTYYFCGEGCKSRFDADPESYLDPSRPARACARPSLASSR